MESFLKAIDDPNERLFLEQLIAAQKQAVVATLSDGVSEQSVIETVNHAAWFAETMAKKCADPNQPPVACKAQCHWCCNQFVRVTAPEAFRVAHYFRTRIPASEQQAVLVRLTQLREEAQGLSAAERGRLNRACAYLFRGRCVIYAARPLMCQRQTSYKVSDCKKAIPLGFPVGSVLSERASLLTHNASIQGLSDGFEAVLKRGPLPPLEMISATHTALTEPDCFERWKADEPIFTHCTFPEVG